MKKPSLKLTIILVIFAIFVIGVLTYVSILGENHKIDGVIVAYFNQLKDGKYLEACEIFSSRFQGEQPATAEHCLNFNFLLELALLKHYDLIDQNDYTVELKRSNFWIPFISDDSVRVSILLTKKRNKGIFDKQPRDPSRELTHNLIVMERHKRSWEIRQFTIADSSLADVYNDLEQHIDLNTYVKRTPDGFRLRNVEINFKTLTPIDKRLLRFSLYKIQKSLDPSYNKDTRSSFPHPSL